MADAQKTEHKDHGEEIEALHEEIRELKHRVHDLEQHEDRHHKSHK